MYRPSVDNRIKCCDTPGTDSQIKLKAALKKLFCDICETLISFQNRLEISGTIGITIDSESVLLLQFSEAFIGRKTSSPAKVADVATLHKNNWMSTAFVADAEQKDETNLRRNCSSNNTLAGDATPDNVSKNGNCSNLANSSDSNDCLIGFNHFDSCPRKTAGGNEAAYSKVEPIQDHRNKSSACDVQETRCARRSNSMLSQLLQRPPSGADVFCSPSGQGNHVWAAPVSASEMLKKMSSRVDGSCPDGAEVPESKANSSVKSEPAGFPGKASSASPGSSYLRELLFQKASGQKTQKVTSERKRKRNKAEQEAFFDENDKEENCRSLDIFGGQQFGSSSINSTDNNAFLQLSAAAFPDKQGSSPSPNAEFSDYRYSMLLHKLVDVRRNQKLDCDKNFLSSLNPAVENGAGRSFDSLDLTFRHDGAASVNSSDLWSRGIKSEVTDRDLLDGADEFDAKFDVGSNSDHATEKNRDSDAC